MGMQNGIGNFSGAIASNIYLARDAPRYILGRMYLYSSLFRRRCDANTAADGLELMFVSIGLIFLALTVFCYKVVNKRRDVWQRELQARVVQLTVDELRKMGDRAPDFRYTL